MRLNNKSVNFMNSRFQARKLCDSGFDMIWKFHIDKLRP